MKLERNRVSSVIIFLKLLMKKSKQYLDSNTILSWVIKVVLVLGHEVLSLNIGAGLGISQSLQHIHEHMLHYYNKLAGLQKMSAHTFLIFPNIVYDL